MHSFTLGTTKSSTYGIRIAGPVPRPVATQRVEDIEVAGRAGTLTRFQGLGDVTLNIPMLFMGKDRLTNYRKFAAALTTAKTIALSHDGGRVRRIKHAQLTPLTSETSGWAAAELTVTCQPYAYFAAPHRQTLNATGSTVVNNLGLAEAAPKLTLTGTGTLRFGLNGTYYVINSPANSITLDSELMTAYTGASAQLNAIGSDFPIMRPGNNTFAIPSTNSGITAWSLEVTWRDP